MQLNKLSQTEHICVTSTQILKRGRKETTTKNRSLPASQKGLLSVTPPRATTVFISTPQVSLAVLYSIEMAHTHMCFCVVTSINLYACEIRSDCCICLYIIHTQCTVFHCVTMTPFIYLCYC